MVTKAAASGLMALLCLGMVAHAQNLDNLFPTGFGSDFPDMPDINQIAKMPGAVTSTSIAVSGRPPITSTTGAPGSGSAMASASTTGVNGRTQTSTTVNGVTTTTNSANAGGNSGVGLCTSVSDTNSKACDGPSGACCSVTSSVRRCKNFISATTTVNGVSSRCCVTLLRAKDKSPALWCAGPPSKSYYSIPATASVVLKPSCATSIAKSTSGSAACIVTWPSMPTGFIAPSGYTPNKPLIYNKGTGFQPCFSPYSRVIQVDGIKNKQIVLTSKCE